MITVVITNQEFTVSATNSVLQACESASYIIKKYLLQIYNHVIKYSGYTYMTCIINPNATPSKINNFWGSINTADGPNGLFIAVSIFAVAGVGYFIYRCIFPSKVETPSAPPGDLTPNITTLVPEHGNVEDKDLELSKEFIESSENLSSEPNYEVLSQGNNGGSGSPISWEEVPGNNGGSGSPISWEEVPVILPSVDTSVQDLTKRSLSDLLKKADSLGVQNLNDLFKELKSDMSLEDIAAWGDHVALLIPHADVFIDVAVRTPVPPSDLEEWSNTLNVTLEVLNEILIALAVSGLEV